MTDRAAALPAPDYRLVFECMPGAYIVLAPDLTILAASDAYLAATMTERAAIVGRVLFDVFPENAADPSAAGMRDIRESLERVLRDRVPDTIALQRYDVRHPAEAGGTFEERYWSLVSSPVFGPNHELVYIIHRVEDVTEYIRLKQLESGQPDAAQALQARTTLIEAEIYGRAQEAQARMAAEAQRARLYSLFMQAPAAICVLRGPNLIYELANPPYRRLVGADRALVGKPLHEALPDVGAEVREILRRVYATGERFLGEEFPVTLDWDNNGRPYTKYLNFVYEPLRDSRGAVNGILAFAYEVTDQVVARQRLALLSEASASLSSLLDYTATLRAVARLAVPTLADYCFFDVVGEDGTVQRVAWAHKDAAFEEALDRLPLYAPQPTSPNHPVMRVIATGATEVVPEITDAWRQQIAISPQHLQFMRDLGAHAALYVPVIARDQKIGVLTFALVEPQRRHSPEDRKLAEELARRAALAIENARLYAAAQHARAEAEQAVRVRDEFLSVAAHELKTPVTSMQGYAQLLLRQIAKGRAPDAERLQRGLETINRQSAKLTQFVEQLLDVSRIAAGRLVLQRQPTDVGRLVGDVAAAMQPASPQHALQVSVRGDTRANVDPLRLEQVVTNLLANAVKYSPGGGPVTIEVERHDAATLRISVTDRGIGVPPEHRARIFERFYQAHGSSAFGGMGLGLSISQSIVQLHGGHLGAEFPAEGGTRMVVSLPVAQDAPGQ